MRKSVVLLTLIAVICASLFLACSVVVAVSFDTNGGSAVETQHLSSGSRALVPSDPTKQGHTFAGWFSDSTLSHPFDFDKTKITKDTTVFAAWAVNTYTISFETNGSAVENITLPYGSPLEIFESYLSGHIFAGWFSDSSLKTAFTLTSMPEYDITLYAGWTEDKDYSAFTFEKNSSGYTLVAVRDIKLNLLSVPETFNNLPVNRVGKAGFRQARQITRIEIPDSVEVIEESAFEGCAALVSTRIPVIETVSARMFYGCTNLKSLILFEGVCVIGKNAFHGCSSLSSLALPSTLTVMEERAFSESGITTVTVPKSVKALGADLFYGCAQLKTVEFESNNKNNGKSSASGSDSSENDGGITRLESGVFEKCTALSSVKIPAGVTFVGSYAFSGCISLTSITLPATLAAMGDFVFFDCKSLKSVSLPDALSTVGSYSFLNCTGLGEVFLPRNLTALDKGVFDGCSSLKKITLPSSLKSIGEGAFHGCSSLAEINLPNDLVSVGFRAFYGCKSLKKVNYDSALRDSLRDVGGYAFSGTTWLSDHDAATDVYIGRVLYRPGSSFKGLETGTVSIAGYAFYGNNNLDTLDISGVEIIGDSAFENSSLSRIMLPTSLAVLGENAFRDNQRLSRVDFSEGLVVIGADAFYDCDLLEEISLPATVQKIGEGAFAKCKSLYRASLPQNDRFNILPENMFSGCISLAEIDLSGITGIGRNAFFGAKTLSRVVFGDGLKFIDTSAFEGCESLSTAKLPDSLSEICAYAFKDTGLTAVTLGRGINTIGEQAFISPFTQTVMPASTTGYEAKGLTVVIAGSPTVDQSFDLGLHVRIILPDTLYNQIQQSTFLAGFDNWRAYKPYVYSLGMVQDGFVISGTRLVAYLGMNSIGDSSDLDNGEDANGLDDLKDTLNIPTGITAIGAYAFYGCGFGGEIVVPDSVTIIGQRAFFGCENISVIKLSESLEIIGDVAFGNMDSLSEITLPATLASVGAKVFRGCTLLEFIYCKMPQSQSSGWNSNWKGDCLAQVLWNR